MATRFMHYIICSEKNQNNYFIWWKTNFMDYDTNKSQALYQRGMCIYANITYLVNLLFFNLGMWANENTAHNLLTLLRQKGTPKIHESFHSKSLRWSYLSIGVNVAWFSYLRDESYRIHCDLINKKTFPVMADNH